ncbi:MAG: sulfite exporter TauE/SafE family protein [Proteobacteria bacterium]|nr:sulfite exporter TauE/SafE family protein [Pseudomonadota bacterium]
MESIEVYLITGLIFLLAGTVKGIVGFGLPLVSITLLTPLYGLVDAIAVMVLPAMVTNFWQALNGGRFTSLWKRLWPLYLSGAVSTVIATSALVQIDVQWPTVLLGSVILAYSLVGLTAWQPAEPGRRETWLSPATGVVTGLITGLTGVLVFPLTIYFQALNLDRRALFQAMGVYLLMANVALALVFGWQSAFPEEITQLALIGIVAGFVGMALGQRIQAHLSAQQFKRVFFCSLAVVGAYIFLRALLS